MGSKKNSGKRPYWHWLLAYLIVGGLVYAAIYYFYSLPKGTPPYTSPQTTNPATVSLTQSGFQPASLTVRVGQTITWSNQTNSTGDVSSSPHPSHTDYPPFNLGRLTPGASVSLTFPAAGTYRYHNHLNASQFGVITVK